MSIELNNYIQEKLKISSNSKINVNDNINNLKDFAVKYGCKIIELSSNINTIDIKSNNNIKLKIKSFFKLNHEEWLDFYSKISDYIQNISNLESKYYTSIIRNSNDGIIKIECKNLTSEIICGNINIYKNDDIISETLNNKDNNKSKIDNLLVNILNYVFNETIK